MLNRALWAGVDGWLGFSARKLKRKLRELSGPPFRLRPLGTKSPALTLIAASPLFGDFRDHPKIRSTGAWGAGHFSGDLPEEAAQFANRGPVDVIVSFSSMAGWPGTETADLIARAIVGAKMRGIIQKGDGNLVPTGAHSDILVLGPAPHQKLFGLASLIVHHGGAGSVHAAAAAGAIQIVVPHVQEQKFWASASRKLGIASHVIDRKRLSTERLLSALVEARDSRSAAENAARFAPLITSERGEETAADLIIQAVRN